MRSRDGGEKVLVKQSLTAFGAEQLKKECSLLTLIHSEDEHSEAARSFPALMDSAGTNSFWFAAGWIEGQTVEQLTQNELMSRTAALDCLISVTEKLIFLHSLKPPVIHRDIKPQNVVIDPMGQCHLIDMGISRQVRQNATEDTFISGTRAIAPPEQFGYRQTDERSDIYSCAILFRYALTGSYEEKADVGLDPDLRQIIGKAAAFDPDQRYQSAEQLLNDLLTARFSLRFRPGMTAKQKRRLLLAVACLCLLCAAVPLSIHFDVPGMISRAMSPAYQFRESLIEQAVREALMKPEGMLTREDLSQVTSIHIYGKQVYQYEEQFWLVGKYDYAYLYDFQQSGLFEQNGGISSLEDVKALPNLTELSVYNQNISDLEPLRGTKIARLGLAHNPITSLAPLRGNGNIQYLNISCLPLDGLGDVSTLDGLRELNLSDMQVNSVEILTSLPLRRIQLYGVSLRNVWELSRMTELETVELQNLDQEGVNALAMLQHLTSLTVTHPMGLPLKALEPLNLLEKLYFYGGETTVPTEGTVRLPHLRSLDMANGQFPDFRWLADMPELREVYFLNAQVSSLDGLDAPPLLMNITCGEPLASRIREAYPNQNWNIQ